MKKNKKKIKRRGRTRGMVCLDMWQHVRLQPFTLRMCICVCVCESLSGRLSTRLFINAKCDCESTVASKTITKALVNKRGAICRTA